MKKLLILMPTLVLGMMFTTSCSSVDNARSADKDPLNNLVGQYMEQIEASLLEGAWEEQGLYYIDENGELKNAHASGTFLPLRINIGKEKSATEYISYAEPDEENLIRTDRNYEYDANTRTFYIVNSLRTNQHYVIDYLSDEYLTLRYSDGTARCVLKRVTEATLVEWNKMYKPEYRGNISEYGVTVDGNNEVNFIDPSLLVSESQFKEIFVGRKLVSIEAHKVEGDGRICEMEFYKTVEGAVKESFLFEDDQCHVMGTSYSGPGFSGPYDHIYTYTYDETCNKVINVAPRFILLKYDAKAEQATFLTGAYNGLVLETFKLMPKE